MYVLGADIVDGDAREESPVAKKERLLKLVRLATKVASRASEELIALVASEVEDGVVDVRGTQTGRVQCKEPNLSSPVGRLQAAKEAREERFRRRFGDDGPVPSLGLGT